MNFNEYQRAAIGFAKYPPTRGLIYTVLGLNGEAGEVAEKVKKIIRDKDGEITPVDAHAITRELGDVLWYVANLANELGYSLEQVAEDNLYKLTERLRSGTIGGSGDDR